MSALWFLLVLACPLMMIFMMRGMHGGGQDRSTETKPQQNFAVPQGQLDSRDERLAELEREVAELRAGRDALSDQPDLSRR